MRRVRVILQAGSATLSINSTKKTHPRNRDDTHNF